MFNKKYKMNRQKVVMVLLIVAIIFSLGSIWLSLNVDNDNLVPGTNYVNTNTETTVETDSTSVAIEIVAPPSGGSA